MRKPYGVYLRGEYGIEKKRYKRIFKNAKFVLGTGEAVCEKARLFCKSVETVTPMIEVKPEDIVKRDVFRRTGPWQILFVGYVVKRKGIEEIIEAASLLKERGIEFQLNVVGGTGNNYDLKTLEKRIPAELNKNIKFTGMIQDQYRLAQYYRDSDLFILPSYDEGFPRVLYEAMTFGVPIVTTFVGGIPYVMKDGVNCKKVEAADSRGLAEAMLELLNNSGLREKLSKGGTSTITELMQSWKKTHAEQVASYIKKLFI